MAWITITENDVLTVLSGPELAGLRAAALDSGQPDPVQPVIDQVTDLVRGYVAGHKPNSLGDEGIPQKLLAPALDIIAVRVLGRVGQDASEGRRRASDQAVALLERVAEGKFAVEEPEVETTEETGAALPSFMERLRRFTHCSEDGL